MKIKITADSTADLSKELCERFDVELIPLTITLGENSYEDGVDINPDMIYDYVDKTKQLPKTSAVNTAKYEEVFNRYLKNGYDAIVHFNISSDMSTANNNAKLVASSMKNVYVIDSRNLSTGIGIQVLYACELASSQKYSATEIVEKVSKRIDHAQASFVLDKLNYLYRGGRCNAVSFLGANLLRIKPCIEVHDGKMGVAKKYLGKYENCVMKYVEDTLKKFNTPDYSHIFVTHTKMEPELVQKVIEYLKKNTQFKEIHETVAGCTVTSHCGSNTIGILYYNDGNEGHK